MSRLNLSPAQQLVVVGVTEKLLLWLIFNVVISLLPFASRGMASFLNSSAVDWHSILADGELFLVAAAIAGGALGDLIISGTRLKIYKIVVGGGCVVCIILSCLLYAYVRAHSGAGLITENVYLLSRNIFIATFLGGTGCMILSGVK